MSLADVSTTDDMGLLKPLLWRQSTMLKGLILKGGASLQETELVHGACITALPTRYCGTSLLSGSECVCAAAVPDAYAKILADHAGAIRVECVPA